MNEKEIEEYLTLIEDLQLYELGDSGKIEEFYQILKQGGELTESDLNYLTRLDISLQKIKKKQVKRTKPVTIVVISVVCSVVAVLGALIGIEAYDQMLYEKGLAFGYEIERINTQYQNKIANTCIPDNSYCYTNVRNSFSRDFNTIAENMGFDYTTPEMQEYKQYAINLLQIEYDYQNQLYDLNSSFDSYYYDDFDREYQDLASYWDNLYSRYGYGGYD